ncbi:Spy/CpxP family protein refolding chaperone [Metapseudomonas otitidis]|uniref:Spy/CpxP family protein refolding chaperone n=1 Tax=Metapseudomonas otitidis TaxID=319939 RepID=UPI0013F5FA83|nr:Spy/CpxP family protein refolding chaperone [Pseudomonas otitidis]
MRKTIAALLFAAALPTVAMAMPEGGPRGEPGFGGPGGHGGHGGPHLFKELDLTREQRQKVGKLMGESIKARHDITRKYLDKLPEAERKAMEAEIKASEDKNRADIRALLTPEQQKDFDAQVKKMDERRAERAEFEAWKAQRAQKAQ